MKGITVVIYLFFCCVKLQAQSADYTLYHKGIIDAEEAIFIRNDSIRGLKLFKATFDKYDFVFVDDCIEAFQLALYFKQDDYAMHFIKKALDNGFELKLLSLLELGCPCDSYRRMRCKVTVYEAFIRRESTYLEAYSNRVYGKYLKRIDKSIFSDEVKRHVEEQLFKNGHPELGLTKAQQLEKYNAICDDNLRYIDSLGKRNIFPGEKNMGLYTSKLADSLKVSFKSIEKCASKLIESYSLPSGTKIPFQTEAEYFGSGIVYNMLFHNHKSYEVISKYSSSAIKGGYMHPREFASLKYRVANHDADTSLVCLRIHKNKIAITAAMNELRSKFLLPSYEIDFAKHMFAHAHDLQLNFGFFNGTM